jgi:hypothetical protein
MHNENALTDFPHLGKDNQKILFSLASPDLIDLATAKLKLALIKENFEYQEFFGQFRKDPKLFLSISPVPESDNPSVRKPTPLFTRAETDKELKDLGYYFERFGLNPEVEKILWFLMWPFSEFLILIDPDKELEEVKNQDLVNALTLFFSPRGIRKPLAGYEQCYFYDRSKIDFHATRHWQKLQPYEHIFIVDLRKGKGQLKREFEKLINRERSLHKNYIKEKPFYTFEKTYHEWRPEGRERKEAWQHLEAWKLRGRGLNFKDISLKMKISEELAKKSFYRAFELTQFKEYDRSIWKTLVGEKLKKIATDPKTKDKETAFKKLLDHGTKSAEGIQADQIDTFEDEEGNNQIKLSLILQDIDKICNKCSDRECYEIFRQAMKNFDLEFESWKPDCPKLYRYLKE